MKFKIFFLLLAVTLGNSGVIAEPAALRIGIQATGTVEWELAALQTEPHPDFQLTIQRYANTEAGKIALQSGAVDMIVSDWVWASRLRSDGTDVCFYPYSGTSGALLVPNASAIQTLKDLQGKRLGIAGGELDKNWLLLQALAQQQQWDVNAAVEKIYAAPPLLNEQFKQGRVDAVLTYWNFAARLLPQGYRQLIDGAGILQALGIDEKLPVLGYVFHQRWAEQHRQALNSFLQSSRRAKQRLCASDSLWQQVLHLTKADDAATQALLRNGYCDGRIEQWGSAQQLALSRVYTLLRSVSGQQLTGRAEQLPAGLFWSID